MMTLNYMKLLIDIPKMLYERKKKIFFALVILKKDLNLILWELILYRYSYLKIIQLFNKND